MERTNWKFGETNINVLALAIVYDGVAFPILISMLDKQGVPELPELQIIIFFNKPEEAQQAYKERWQVETAFRALKSSGFNIEDTHLTDLNRIEKLFSIVMVAFA